MTAKGSVTGTLRKPILIRSRVGAAAVLLFSATVDDDGRMSGTRDYVAWHDRYDDPASSLPRRLAMVRAILDVEVNDRTGPVRVLSLCAGDGRDVLGTLAERHDAGRVSVDLVELHPELASRARSLAGDVKARVDVIVADAGCSSTYRDLATVPADIVLLVGVLGNICESDVNRTLGALPALCAPGATAVWTRGRSLDGATDFVTPVRDGLAAAGFIEKSIGSFDDRDDPAVVGVVRYDGPPAPLGPATTWFTFLD